MRIAIVVHGPDFACSENLVKAFALWGETRLISIYPSDFRDYDPGLLVDSAETMEEAREILAAADMIFLGDATALFALGKLSPQRDWLKWARKQNLVAYFGDSAYHRHPQYTDGLCMAAGIERLFLLPNLMPLTELSAVPLHHPMPLMEADRAVELTVMHAPGRNGKAYQKGTAAIEEVITELQEELDFDYKRLMYLTLEECLEIKATAHIVIDQLPPEGLPFGLGRTGLEALAAGSAVLTAVYDFALLDGYFEPPPVVPIHSLSALKQELKKLVEDEKELADVQARSVKWAAENVELEPWLQYVGKFL